MDKSELIKMLGQPKRVARFGSKESLQFDLVTVIVENERVVGFRRLKAPQFMKDVYRGVKYVNGVVVRKVSEEKAA